MRNPFFASFRAFAISSAGASAMAAKHPMLLAIETFLRPVGSNAKKVELTAQDAVPLGGLQIERVDCGRSTAYLLLALNHVPEADKIAPADFLRGLNERGETIDFNPTLDSRQNDVLGLAEAGGGSFRESAFA